MKTNDDIARAVVEVLTRTEPKPKPPVYCDARREPTPEMPAGILLMQHFTGLEFHNSETPPTTLVYVRENRAAELIANGSAMDVNDPNAAAAMEYLRRTMTEPLKMRDAPTSIPAALSHARADAAAARAVRRTSAPTTIVGD